MKFQTISLLNSFSCCKVRELLCSYSNGDLYTCEDNMFFSQVKISCFRRKPQPVSHWCLYNKIQLAQQIQIKAQMHKLEED